MVLFFFTEVCFKKWCCLGGFFQRCNFGEVSFYEVPFCPTPPNHFHLDGHMIWSHDT